MNELATDLKSLHEATLNNLKSSKANNTLRAYKSDFKDFGAFCAKHGLNSLPSEPKINCRKSGPAEDAGHVGITKVPFGVMIFPPAKRFSIRPYFNDCWPLEREAIQPPRVECLPPKSANGSYSYLISHLRQ